MIGEPREEQEDRELLQRFGERLRAERTRRQISRRLLASRAGISERYITLIESGRGNVSLVILRRISAALGTPLSRLVETQQSPSASANRNDLLEHLTPAQIEETLRWIAEQFPGTSGDRRQRIALLGMRGAGKSTLGRALADRMNVPFYELDREVEQLAGTSIGSLLEMYGYAAYRRYELEALERLLASSERLVVATGGGIVTEPASWRRLQRETLTVWIRATPGEHMQRVIEQGDYRPMSGSERAMEDLERILQERTPLYSRADLTLDTSGRTEAESLRELEALIAGAQAGVKAEI